MKVINASGTLIDYNVAVALMDEELSRTCLKTSPPAQNRNFSGPMNKPILRSMAPTGNSPKQTPATKKQKTYPAHTGGAFNITGVTAYQ